MSKVNLIIPTRNEEGNIPKLMQVLKPYGYQIVIVDDSDDNTAELAEKLGATVIHGRRKGLAQAVLDGIDQTYGDYIIVMDADLQHPHEMLPEIVHQLDYHDLVTATKHTKEAMADMSAWRKLQSNLAVWLTHFVIPAPVSDPMTGFFGIRRNCLDGIPRKEFCQDGEIGIEAIGFKIGLELFVKAKWATHAEVPIVFGKREAGESKGTAHSLHKHLWHLFNDTLHYEIELPEGSQEYHAFYEANLWQKDWKQSIAFKLQQITEDLIPIDLLDIGCGSSPNINYMWAAHKTGMDIRKEAADYLKEHSNSNTKFAVGSVLDIPFGDNTFDCISCIEVIEHLQPDEAMIAIGEISRVLKPKGHAIIATPNYNSVLWNVIENLQKYFQRGEWTSDHHTKFKHKMLTGMCKRFGGLDEVRYDTVMAGMDMIATYQKNGG